MSKLPAISGQECIKRTIAKGTLRNIIRQAGLTIDEFIDLL